jgi:hypothetical protein
MVSFNSVALDLSGIGRTIDAYSTRTRAKVEEEEAKRKRAALYGGYADELLGETATSGGAGGGAPSRGAELMGLGNNYADAVAGMESGGRYDAVGPTHPRLGRALGKYQVMEANVGPWTEKHLGRRLTGDQFLADREAQDAVFRGQFGEYASRHGPADAFSMWQSGRPLAQAQGARDSLGTRTTDYVNRGMAALGHKAPQPVTQEAGTQQIQTASRADADIPIAGGTAVKKEFVLPGARGVTSGQETRRITPEQARQLRAMIESGEPEAVRFAMNEIQRLRAGPKYEFKTARDGSIWRTDDRGNAEKIGGQEGGGPTPLFGGTGLEAQGLNQMVARGEITPEQASQYATAKIIADEKGQQRFVTPQEFFAAQRAAQGGPSSVSQPVAPAAGAPGAPVGGGGVGTPITGPRPTTADKPTEAEARNRGLVSDVIPEIAILNDTFDKMGGIAGTAGEAIANRTGVSTFTPVDHERASAALKRFAQTYLYVRSGQNAPDAEVEKLASSLVPRIGEGEASLQDKRDRINNLIRGMKETAWGNRPEAPQIPQIGGKKSDAAPVPGAKKAPDGKWYVKGPNGYLRVDD